MLEIHKQSHQHLHYQNMAYQIGSYYESLGWEAQATIKPLHAKLTALLQRLTDEAEPACAKAMGVRLPEQQAPGTTQQ